MAGKRILVIEVRKNKIRDKREKLVSTGIPEKVSEHCKSKSKKQKRGGGPLDKALRNGGANEARACESGWGLKKTERRNPGGSKVARNGNPWVKFDPGGGSPGLEKTAWEGAIRAETDESVNNREEKTHKKRNSG